MRSTGVGGASRASGSVVLVQVEGLLDFFNYSGHLGGLVCGSEVRVFFGMCLGS